MNRQPASKTPLQVIAWIILLLVSTLPTIIRQEILGHTVTAEQQAIFSLAVLLVALLAGFFWRPLRSLRLFLILFGVQVISRFLVYNRIDELPFYRAWLRNPSFNVYMLAEQSLNLMITLIVIVTLLMMKKKPADFYLRLGDISAPAQPIRWLGVKQGERWKELGAWLTFFISLGTLAFLILAGRPSPDMLPAILPFLPAILLAAALNAFNEEVTYKASLLSVLENPLGARQALYMVALLFGVGHYYGVPYGVIGVILATFLGWILAKSMQETRGMFWAWFIHFWQDVWIFSFMAIGTIIPGGG